MLLFDRINIFYKSYKCLGECWKNFKEFSLDRFDFFYAPVQFLHVIIRSEILKNESKH